MRCKHPILLNAMTEGGNGMNTEQLIALTQEQIPDAALAMDSADVPMLVNLLSEKKDAVRYAAFKLPQCRSAEVADVYPFWDTFCTKLHSENSYQRSLGIMLLAENTKWDAENKMESTIPTCLSILKDNKPITLRQGIQSLGKIAEAKPTLGGLIAEAIAAIDIASIRETMRKCVLLDSLRVLATIRQHYTSDALDAFIFNALTGGVLDRNSEREMRALFSWK